MEKNTPKMHREIPIGTRVQTKKDAIQGLDYADKSFTGEVVGVTEGVIFWYIILLDRPRECGYNKPVKCVALPGTVLEGEDGTDFKWVNTGPNPFQKEEDEIRRVCAIELSKKDISDAF